MAGVSDIYFTSLRLAKGESVAEASPAPLVRVPGVATSVSSDTGGQARAVDVLTAGFTARLNRFASALERFSWPANAGTLFSARLVIHDDNAAFTAKAQDAGTAVNPLKYFSKGKNALEASGIDPGTYCFSIRQGTAQSTFGVTITAGESWGSVLGKVAQAINQAASGSVHADVVRQQQAFTLDPSLVATGSFLTLSVNPTRRDQTVVVNDTRGDLLEQLSLTAVPNVDAPATPAVYELSVDQLAQPTFLNSTAFDPGAATTLPVGLYSVSFTTGGGDQPTTYASTARDPNATTTLAPGTYAFTVRLGEQSRDLSVTVKSGWTWASVFSAVAAQINANPVSVWSADGTSTEMVGAPSFSLPGVTATVQNVTLPTADGGTQAGRILSVNTTDGYDGQVLALTDGSGGILAALGLTAPLRGQVVSVAVSAGDTWKAVLNSVARSLSLATTRVAAQTVATPIPSTAVANKSLTLAALATTMTLLDRRLGETLTLYDGAGGLLANLGLNTKLPGQDGQITVNGESIRSENNTYGLQSGRILVDAAADTAGPLPLVVTQTMDAVATRLDDILAAYNDLRKYLTANRDIISSTVGNQLSQPVTDNWTGLASLGFTKTRKNDLLWISSDDFWHAFATNADTTRRTLVDAPSGLIPGWKQSVSDIKAAGIDSTVPPETTHLYRVAVRRTASDLERKNWLVDLQG